jgi:hypothetical protein
MTTIVSRLYANAEKANAVKDALHKAGARKGTVGVVTGGKGVDVAGAIKALGLPGSSIDGYAAHVAKGAALTVCHAPWKKSMAAAEIMDAHDPLPAPVKNEAIFIPSAEQPSKWRNFKPPVNLVTGMLLFSDGLFPPAVIRNHRPNHSIKSNHSPRAGLVSGTMSERIGMPLLKSKRSAPGSMMSGTISGKMGVPTVMK